jgi:hypothetical protein
MIMPGLAPGMIVFGVPWMGQRAASAYHRGCNPEEPPNSVRSPDRQDHLDFCP